MICDTLLVKFFILENICLKNTSLSGNVPFFFLPASILSAQFKIIVPLILSLLQGSAHPAPEAQRENILHQPLLPNSTEGSRSFRAHSCRSVALKPSLN